MVVQTASRLGSLTAGGHSLGPAAELQCAGTHDANAAVLAADWRANAQQFWAPLVLKQLSTRPVQGPWGERDTAWINVC